jgi:hypothetical protein
MAFQTKSFIDGKKTDLKSIQQSYIVLVFYVLDIHVAMWSCMDFCSTRKKLLKKEQNGFFTTYIYIDL